MKRILCFAVVLGFTGAISAFAGQQIKRETWSGVQTYDIPALQKIESSQVGKIVGIRINYRGNRVGHPKPNWYDGSIRCNRPGEKDKFPFLRVMVAKQDLASFKSIPTDINSPAEIVVYGQVARDTQANFLFVQLLGRKVTLDSAGNATIDW
ncbi:MAG: hypothetical protein DMF06_13680 [Verrucomicrobia bacterium]|nr:MAG: hypothetical protein DMF06_13680 [Verrucomicrobiota bacterium]